MDKKINYIIYAPPYDEDSGGAIVLHKLCSILRGLGYESYLWPINKPFSFSFLKRVKHYLRRKDKNFKLNAEYDASIASYSDLNEKSVVVYPETINGNPLQADNVVRWLLHKPGFHTSEAIYNDSDLFFFFDENCIDEKYNIDIENKLFTINLNPLYTLPTKDEREGSCYMMRKGEGRDLVHALYDSVNVDGLSHSETAAIFKKTKYFYCYDEFTMYSQFAALCGCISVVIPCQYDNREDWVEKHPISKFGIAYGIDDIDHAVKTSTKVSTYFLALERDSINSVKNFVSKTKTSMG